MHVRKYKYYLRKPKSEIVKDVFSVLLIVGVVCIAATSPYFVQSVIRGFRKSRWEKYPKQKIRDVFNGLRRKGYVKIEKKGKQTYISLTGEGRKKAGIYQISCLEVKKPKKWDGKWRIAIFDISEMKKLHREAFRGKLKELGFYPLQKSTWIHPYDCRAEMELLKDFFGLDDGELRLVVASHIGQDADLRKFFKLKN